MEFTRALLLKVHGVSGSNAWQLAENIRLVLERIPENNSVDIIPLPATTESGDYRQTVFTLSALVVEKTNV